MSNDFTHSKKHISLISMKSYVTITLKKLIQFHSLPENYFLEIQKV
jgi:hypothetical protein